MKQYFIEIALKYDAEPQKDTFEYDCNLLVDKMKELYSDANLIGTIVMPSQEDLELRRYFYRLRIHMDTDNEISSKPLFDVLNGVCPLALVHLRETRFCKQDAPIYWEHEGETTYYDGSTYKSPNYDFYVNGETYYTVQYVPLTLNRLSERDKKRYNGVTYMWRCTGSWDNFMESTTLDEALEEFENFYYKLLWDAVEANNQRLAASLNKFNTYNQYRLNKNN